MGGAEVLQTKFDGGGRNTTQTIFDGGGRSTTKKNDGGGRNTTNKFLMMGASLAFFQFGILVAVTPCYPGEVLSIKYSGVIFFSSSGGGVLLV